MKGSEVNQLNAIQQPALLAENEDEEKVKKVKCRWKVILIFPLSALLWSWRKRDDDLINPGPVTLSLPAAIPIWD